MAAVERVLAVTCGGDGSSDTTRNTTVNCKVSTSQSSSSSQRSLLTGSAWGCWRRVRQKAGSSGWRRTKAGVLWWAWFIRTAPLLR